MGGPGNAVARGASANGRIWGGLDMRLKDRVAIVTGVNLMVDGGWMAG